MAANSSAFLLYHLVFSTKKHRQTVPLDHRVFPLALVHRRVAPHENSHLKRP